MGLPSIILANQFYYRKKTLPVILLCGMIIFLPASTYLLVRHITGLADLPLAELNTELLLQKESAGKDAASINTMGLLEPFNLEHFGKEMISRHLADISGITRFSTTLALWQFDPKNTTTVIGLDKSDPQVGLRKIESMLMGGSRFFRSNQSEEVILERHFAKLFGHDLGGFFQLAGRSLKIVGLVDFTEQSNLSNAAVFLPLATALDLSGQKEKVVNQVFISLASSGETKAVSAEIGRVLPDFSLISRDTLYKNLSALNQLIYSGGHLLTSIVCALAALLLFWILKIYLLEFFEQVIILKTLGWPRKEIRAWHIFDIGFLLIGGLFIAGMLCTIVGFFFLPAIQLGSLIEMGFSL